MNEMRNSSNLLSPKTGILNQTRLRPHNTSLQPSAIEGKIINTLIRLKNSGLAEGSLRTISYNLKLLARNCILTSVRFVAPALFPRSI